MSHSFTLQDSLARGFHRKYSILILMCDKVHLLNSWPFIVKHIKELARDLQAKAAAVNDAEQAHKSQRAVRQAQGSPSSPPRSLSQLTGEPAVFSHIHLWFSWMLSSKTCVERHIHGPPLPVNCNPTKLRQLALEIPEECFRTACYCVLTGIGVLVEQKEVEEALMQLLPQRWPFPKNGDLCKLTFEDGKWSVSWSGCLPSRLPTLQVAAEKAFRDERIPEEALKYHLTSLILHWLHVARSLVWSPKQDQNLLQALGVQKYDLPLLTFWMSHCQ